MSTTTMTAVRAEAIAAVAGVSKGRANDLAHAGFVASDTLWWAPTIAIAGVSEAGLYRQLGFTAQAALEAAASGVNAMALVLAAVRS